MTTPARKPKTAKSNVVKLPRPKKPALTSAKIEAATPPATRPLMDIASTQKVELERQGREAIDEVSMIDAIQAKADEAHSVLLASLETERAEKIAAIEKTYANKVLVATDAFDQETKGRADLRSEYVTIAARCHAALTVDEAAVAAFVGGLTDGAEGQGQ